MIRTVTQHLAEAGAVVTGAGLAAKSVLAQAAPHLDNQTPPAIALAIICLACLGVVLKLSIDNNGRHDKSTEVLRQLATGQVQMADAVNESNKRLDEMCQKIVSKPCIAQDQDIVEKMADRIADRVKREG